MNHIGTRLVAVTSSVFLGFGFIWVLLLMSTDQGSITHPPAKTAEESLATEGSVHTTVTTSSEAIEAHGSVPNQITDLVIPEDLFGQKHAITSWVALIDKEQTLDWLKQSTNVGWEVSTKFRIEFQKSLVQKLSQSSPNRALEFALSRNEPIRSSLGSVVFIQWAAYDLDGAIERAKTLDEFDWYWVLYSIFQSQSGLNREQQKEIAREFGNESYVLPYYFNLFLGDENENPQDLWYEIVEHATRDNHQYVEIFATVATAWINQTGLEILDEITASIKDQDMLRLVAERVIDIFSDVEEQTSVAFEYVLNLEDNFPQKFDILDSIIDKWAKQDPKTVLRRTQSLPSSQYKVRMVEAAYREEALDDPTNTLENLADVPNAHRAEVGAVAVSALSQTSPTEAAKLVRGIADKDLQQTVATALIRSWSQQDLDGAKNWVLNLPEDEPLRDSLLAPLADLLVETDPHSAFQIALQQSLYASGGNIRGHETQIVKQIAQNNIELAIELLPRVREEPKWNAYHDVALALIREGNSHRAILLGNELAEQEQKKFFNAMTVWKWVDADAEGLKNNIEQLESSETRSHIAYLMIILNSSTRAYSTEEVQSLKQHLTTEFKEIVERREQDHAQ